MVGGFLSGILGKMAKGASSDAKGGLSSDTVKTAFWMLEQWQSGLGERAVGYVLSGDDRPVLMEIETQRKVPRQRPDYRDRDYHDRAQKMWTALHVLTAAMGGQPERLARFAEVQLAFQGPVNLRYTFSGKTQYKAPEAVSRLLGDVGRYGGIVDLIDPEVLTGPEDVLAAVKILGGTASDILMYDIGRSSSNRLVLEDGHPIGDALLTSMATDEILQALRAMDAGTRSSALEAFASHERSKDPELVDYLMGELGVTSAKVREQARLILMKHPAESIESRIIEALSAGKTSVRTEAAIIAGEIGNEACRAALSERLTLEKAAATLAIVEQYVGHGKTGGTEEEAPEGSYLAADGQAVSIPEFNPLPEDTTPALDAEDAKALAQAREARDRESLERYKERLADAKRRGHDVSGYSKPVPIGKVGDNIIDWLSTGIDKHNTLSHEGSGHRRFVNGYVGTWLLQRLDKLPLKRQIQIVAYSTRNLQSVLYDYRSPVDEQVLERMDAGEFDLRHVIDEAAAMQLVFNLGNYNNPVTAPVSSQALIEMLVERGGGIALPDAAVWPMLAERIPLLVDALPPKTSSAERNRRALRLLARFPKLPASAVQSVIFCAISERPGLRDKAQAMLTGIEGVDTRLIAVLDDKRQAVRGNAARFLADRGCVDAVKPIEKRLKKEKSENARAEMISALARLGADTAPYLGREALLAEAEKLAAKLPAAKLEWLPLAQVPALHWKGGETLPETVIDAWLKLALKLKQPGGSPLFGLYLDQLEPDDVTALADWLLSAWIAYDSARGDAAELREQARKQAESIKASNNHSYYQNQTIDQLTEMYLRPLLANYPNSGIDSKGILALTHRATPATMVQRIQSYLKNHGKRVSQAKTLVEVLAATGTPEALQVLVATATRFKQRTVRELAEQLVGEIATARGWSEDELADRSVPSGGFEDDGTLELEVGEAGKRYTVRLGEDLAVKIFNPDGKAVKALPAGKDETTKESKALLSAAKKTVKTVTTQQAERLFGAMVAERRWTIEDWRTDILAHPIVRRLTERVIWLGLNEDKEIVASFRPTPEGDFLSADGDDVNLDPVAYVGIAHTSHVDEETRQAWLSHMDDFEVKPLFGQIERPMQELTEAQCAETALDDRKGWLMESLKLRSMTTRAGFERGPVEDGAGFSTYVKPFRSAGITAVLNFSGSYVPEDNIPAAIIDLHFVKGDGVYGKKIKLGDVPAILLSECWADLHQIAEGGSYDTEWKKKGLY